MAMLNVRLDEDLEKRLNAEAARTGQRRSEIVRRVLNLALPPGTEELSTRERYARVRHLIGSVRSGIPDLGSNHEKHLRRVFDAKRDDTMGRRAADRAD